MSDDAQLLREFAREGSETAFRELVERHLPLVNSTARRITAGDAHLAQDVTQIVFTDLARKAASLDANVVLGGWLYRHTCYTAMKAIRTENRRRQRERTAMELNALNDSPPGDAQWLQLAPVLDDALNQLNAADRDAIVLRYLQQRDVRSVGAALGASENAAQKRLGRALEKLRAILTRRGVTVSAALLATALDAGAATTPVSSGLAASISTNALVGASTATAAPHLLTTLKTMITSKLALGVAAFAAGVVTTVLVTQNAPQAVPAPTPAVKKSASAPVAQFAANHVEAPAVAPAPAHDAAPGSQARPMSALPESFPVSGTTAMRVISMTTQGSGAADPFGQISVMGSGNGGPITNTATLSIANPADPTGGNTRTMVISSGAGGPAQFQDNGDGTMSVTQPDGSTIIIPKPQVPVSTTDNGDGTVTMTMPDGSTQTVKVVTATASGGSSGSGVVTSGAP